LWLSVQTDLLDTQPELEIVCNAFPGLRWTTFEHHQLAPKSEAPATESPATGSQSTIKLPDTGASPGKDAPRGPAALLCSSPPGSGQAAAQGLWLIEPTDQCHARRCSEEDQAEQCLRLFGHFMEKGVIRR